MSLKRLVYAIVFVVLMSVFAVNFESGMSSYAQDTGSSTLLEALALPLCDGLTPVYPEGLSTITQPGEHLYYWTGEPAGVTGRSVWIFGVTDGSEESQGSLNGYNGYPDGWGLTGVLGNYPAGPGFGPGHGLGIVSLPDLGSANDGTYNWIAVLEGDGPGLPCRSIVNWMHINFAPPNFNDIDGDGYTVEQGDCNDLDPTIHPGAEDEEGDGVDSNCDGVDGYPVSPVLVSGPTCEEACFATCADSDDENCEWECLLDNCGCESACAWDCEGDAGCYAACTAEVCNGSQEPQ